MNICSAMCAAQRRCPRGKGDAYQFATLRTGKSSGSYYGWDFDTEAEYGITDKFQLGLAIAQHHFDARLLRKRQGTSFGSRWD